MKTLTTRATTLLMACSMVLLLAMPGYAGKPTTKELDAALKAGDFSEYFANLSTWLNRNVPSHRSRLSVKGMKRLLRNRVLANTLSQRQLLAKLGVENAGAFAKADLNNKKFLAWLMQNTLAMDLYLEAATPTPFHQREADNWKLSTGALDIWKTICFADKDSRKGIYLKLAIAVSLSPPGTGDRGAGQKGPLPTPLERYKHYKAAHKKNLLVPSFNNLTVWEMRRITNSNASNADLAWGNEMVRTWQVQEIPGEKVVNTTSRVWRRGSPWGYKNGYRSVMEGGGKCGPRCSWGVFICRAFGIPAVGVRQPGHVYPCHKSPGGWKITHGKGLGCSKIEGQKGPDWMAAVHAREYVTRFSRVEHLRWLASALTSKKQAAVKAIAGKIAKEKPAAKGTLTASEDPNGACINEPLHRLER